MRRFLTMIAMTLGGFAAMSAAAPEPRGVQLTQLGFETAGSKRAIVFEQGRRPLPFNVLDEAGAQVLTGVSQPFGPSGGADVRVHRIDLSPIAKPGRYVLAIGGMRRGFMVADRPYDALAQGALAFFYQQRSGEPILRAFVERDDLARPAGHRPQIVSCFSGRDERGLIWPACPPGYRLDVTGGWYDAGDHGEYVVNGGISAWTVLNAYETARRAGGGALMRDGALAIPENRNGVSDLLDEARHEVGFLLAMQVPAGARMGVARRRNGSFVIETIDAGGLVHQKVADDRWTGIPTAPAEDRQPRLLYPPTTAATLNMAAVAAQAARLWRGIDDPFAARALAAARRAFDAALAYPDLLATASFAGSGGYADDDLRDEFYWAAAELLATTGEVRYGQVVRGLAGFRPVEGTLGWGRTALAGAITLALADRGLDPEERRRLRAALTALADSYLAEGTREGYAVPRAGLDYAWGSNGDLSNRGLLLGVAYDLTGDPRYRQGVVDVIDYLTGRNPLDQSYVAGIGERAMRAPHHRFWAHAADPRYPSPPTGALSGGPNSSFADRPEEAASRRRCAGQTCWVDDYREYTVNEVAINWNAPLAWDALFLARTRPGPAGRR